MASNMFMDAVKTEQERIQRFVDLSQLDGEERGSLYIQKKDNRYYGYERWQKKGEWERKVYLGPLGSEPVRELCSIKIKEKRLIRLRYDQKLLEKLEHQYQMYDYESIVADMPKAYRMAAKDESFDKRYEEIRKWANADYPKNTYPFSEAEIYAKDGTRMRSKGECIWYNLLQERGVLFRYDCEIEFVDKLGITKKVCPDFLIMCFDGTLIIIEHLGRMGDHSYATRFGDSSYWYFQEGFILGRNYFVTSDDQNYGTDSQMIARLVDRVEKMFYGF